MAKRVLVVDDELHIRQIVRLHLEAAGIEVHEAGDGASALQAVRARTPDAIILDLGLPDIAGSEVLRQLRAEARFAAVPVIILTALGDDDTGLDAATSLVTKPFSSRDLVEQVQRDLATGTADA